MPDILDSWGGDPGDRVDQAAGLRRLFGTRPPQVVAFASGYESSGRTTLVIQTAVALATAGHGVVIVDENPAPNNTISAFGLRARHDLAHAFLGERSVRQVMLSAAPLIQIVPAARAAKDIGHADGSGHAHLTSCLREMQRGASFVLVDCAHRRGGHLSPVALAARHMAVVVAAQSTAITHAYALIKRLAQEREREGFQIVITRARADEEAQAIFDNMQRVAREHLGVRLSYLGSAQVPVTAHLADALVRRLPMPVADEEGGGFLSVPVGTLRFADRGAMGALDSVV